MPRSEYAAKYFRRPAGKKRLHCWLPQAACCLHVRSHSWVLVLWHTPGIGYMPERFHRVGCSRASDRVWDWGVVDVKKRTIGTASANSRGVEHLAPVETKVLSVLTNLVSHMATVRYDDGETRQPGQLILKTQGAAWVVVVKDPDACAQLQCVGQTLDDALALADLLLGAEDAPWELDRWAADRARKSKK